MKANELMTGDWVIATDNGAVPLPSEVADMLPRVGKVVGIDCDCIMLDFVDFGFMLDGIEPIPLTPEILEKNGFDKYGNNLIYEKDGLYMQIKLGAFVRIFCGMDNSVSFNRDFYVHTLQHALRLCGIEKEIRI